MLNFNVKTMLYWLRNKQYYFDCNGVPCAIVCGVPFTFRLQRKGDVVTISIDDIEIGNCSKLVATDNMLFHVNVDTDFEKTYTAQEGDDIWLNIVNDLAKTNCLHHHVEQHYANLVETPIHKEAFK